MRRFVVLRHSVPDGSWHLDWMIETRPSAGPDDRSLLTFRTTSLPTESPTFEAERIGDHRACYLDFEGHLGAGRGLVTRVLAWQADAHWEGARLLVRCATVHHSVQLEGVSSDGVRFRFSQRTPQA